MSGPEDERIVQIFDFLVNIFIFITGIFVLLLGVSLMNFFDAEIAAHGVNNAESTDWISKIPWIINTTGIIVILYSFKRIVKSYLNV